MTDSQRNNATRILRSYGIDRFTLNNHAGATYSIENDGIEVRKISKTDYEKIRGDFGRYGLKVMVSSADGYGRLILKIQ